jgi:hypothetical protein
VLGHSEELAEVGVDDRVAVVRLLVEFVVAHGDNVANISEINGETHEQKTTTPPTRTTTTATATKTTAKITNNKN